VFYRLEAEGFECVLADAKQVKHLPGRPKRDSSDSSWLAACFERGAVRSCALFCTFHHQVVIHQMGWTVVLNPDGTTTAWNKDRTKVLHSHSPPARPG